MSEEKVCTFIKKRKNVNIRGQLPKKDDIEEKKVEKKKLDDENSESSGKEESSESEDECSLLKTKQKAKPENSRLFQSTKSSLKKLRTDNDVSKEGEFEENDLFTTFKSDKNLTKSGPQDMGATATYELDSEHSKDARSIFERAKKIQEELKNKVGDDKVYRGINNYQQFIEVKDTAQGNASNPMVRNKGPIRAPSNIRSTVRWDYAPDICKDYKETGFCGFGDSCKFLHDRSDYKHGWQLEQEWDKQQSKLKNKGDDDDTNYEIKNEGDDDEMPFKCFICRQSFVNPVVTRCKHYFCETCFIKNNKRSSRCYACGQPTMGFFQAAKEILKRRTVLEGDVVEEADS